METKHPKPWGAIRWVDACALTDFLKELLRESDRAAVILSASKIDLLLSQILQKHLLPCAVSHDDLFEGEGPLSTFSSRIHLAFRLGFYDNVFAHSLHMIRRIRNDFAHEAAGSSLNTPPYRDKVKSLSAPFVKTDLFDSLKTFLLKGQEKNSSSDYRIIVSLIVLFLETMLYASKTIKPKPFILTKILALKYPGDLKEDRTKEASKPNA